MLRIAGDMAIAQTVDFFTPIVDDPFLFGAIAAVNSVSDIYAMGAKPILGLAIAAFPTDKLPLEVLRNSTGKPGDLLYLTKPIGNGILVSAFRALSGRRFRKPPSLDEAIRWMLMLSDKAAEAMVAVRASAATDVTGYGLIGHLLEMCVGAGIGAEISAAAVPVLAGARQYLKRGFRPSGTERNLESFRNRVKSSLPESELTLLCDAQTSGGLLIAMAPERAHAFERAMAEGGLFYAKIGRLTDASHSVTLIP